MTNNTLTIRPRELQHRGVISASGFLFDLTMRDEREARRRVLSLWEPGATVYRLPDLGLLLRLPAPRPISSETAPGIPLVLQDDCLYAAPLDLDEREKLAPPFGSLIVLRGGKAVVLAVTGAMREDCVSWLDVTGWKAADVKTLGLPPAPPRHPAAAPPFDPRAKLTGVPKADAERERIIDAIRKAQAGGAKSGGAGEGFAEKAGRWLRGVAQGAADALGVEGEAPTGSSDLYNMARHLTARLAFMTGLAGVIGRRQAEYMRHMMELFERGDLQEALKYAIALGELTEGPPPPHSLDVPVPRTDLSINPHRTKAGSSIGVSGQLNERLREIYRQAFRKLEQEGRIEEAAFTLAELLGANEEAVNFLEKHGKLRLAAEMAEARKLPPGLVVRQWFLAGDIPRAILTARRANAFADAVRRLEQKDAQAGRELRRHWADTLAEAGDYSGALEAIAPLLPEMRELITERMQIAEWLDKAIAAGGPSGARMLIRKLAFQPTAAAEVRTQILALLEDEGAETAPDRLALADALCDGEAAPLSRTLARAAVRALLRDAGNGYGPTDKIVYNKVLRFTEDAALRAAAPAPPAAPKADFAAQSPPLYREFTLADSGSLPIYDAAFLPGGRSLVALGEAGLRLLNREGRTITHFEIPAHRLVVSDNGGRALALAPRGETWRIAKDRPSDAESGALDRGGAEEFRKGLRRFALVRRYWAGRAGAGHDRAAPRIALAPPQSHRRRFRVGPQRVGPDFYPDRSRPDRRMGPRSGTEAANRMVAAQSARPDAPRAQGSPPVRPPR